MCNIAGYIGPDRAAPALMEMMEKQEGLAGGYYSGIATVADGELHYAKVVGDFARLRAETDAENLPGTIGIAHSRSKSGGDHEWAHPFVDCAGRMAYIANGAAGIFKDTDRNNRVARQLADAGHTFRSRAAEAVGQYPQFANGSGVHVSEVMCHLIEQAIADSQSPADAMARAFCEFPSEIVGLSLCADHPDHVFAARINMPLMFGRYGDAMLMASTAMAFPDGTEWLAMMPPNASASIRNDGVDIQPFARPPARVADFVSWGDVEERILAASAEGEWQPLRDPWKATTDLWPQGQAPQKDMMVYETLRALKRAGRIEMKDVPVEGAEEGLTAPQRWVRRVR